METVPTKIDHFTTVEKNFQRVKGASFRNSCHTGWLVIISQAVAIFNLSQKPSVVAVKRNIIYIDLDSLERYWIKN